MTVLLTISLFLIYGGIMYLIAQDSIEQIRRANHGRKIYGKRNKRRKL